MKSLKDHSKLLSLVLRHQPEFIGITLTEEGWADVAELMEKANQRGFAFSAALVADLVASSDKQRFKLSDDGRSIRANQGHSVSVDVGLVSQSPPETLFHGTATRFLASIREQGLLAGSRQYVHLSSEEATAVNVGKRHGCPVVLVIESGQMQRAGFEFFLSENRVWLIKKVPTEYIRF